MAEFMLIERKELKADEIHKSQTLFSNACSR